MSAQSSLFVVLGAGSGFGEAIAIHLLDQGHTVLAVARHTESILAYASGYESKCEVLAADVMEEGFGDKLMVFLNNRTPQGIVINASGPPAGGFFDVTPRQWEAAYYSVLHWKMLLLHKIIPIFKSAHYGRVVMIESVSIKQPVAQLILSNALRAGVAGMVRTLADEVAGEGITINIMAPGYHDTQAMQRLYKRKSETQSIGLEAAREIFTAETGTGELGTAGDFASLAAWLLSPEARYVTGQTISIAGNLVKGIMG
ncbi:MAG: SDR family oxidoreductase [Lentimicrobium sp.]|jgi:3-oxoacyl-[acyl-carrier protein] reductase|nr:SDR family oxidoreductase [Lentimicrobium sp.]